MTQATTLDALHDVDRVVGSFVASAEGDLLLCSMPSTFDQHRLMRMASRVATIVRSAELAELQVDRCDFRLGRHQLEVSRFDGGWLCVMAEAPVNRRALRMAIRVTLEALPDAIVPLTSGETRQWCPTEPREPAPPRDDRDESRGLAPRARPST
jgi:predicted regulator of Ras-like GTPase activity (Roadblock/LC7/MglB family)